MPRASSRRTVRRLLFLTCHLPWPPHSGGRRREYELLRRIGGELDVELYAVCKSREDWDHIDVMAEHCADVRLFEPDPLASADELAALDRYGLHRSRACTDAVRRRLSGDDLIVHVEGSYLMQHLPRRAYPHSALVEQNIESSLWKQRADVAGGSGRDRSLEWWRRTRRAESNWWARAGACAAVSHADATEIARRSGRDVVLIPDGADHLRPAGAVARVNGVDSASSADVTGEVLMISNFAYEPNVQAARFLVEEVFERVRPQIPSARCLLVGNGPPPDVKRLHQRRGVVVTGRVDSVEPYRDRATVIAAPHRIGGGVKVQVLEAIASGKPLVATSVALQGLPPGARAELRPADGADEFARALTRALTEPTYRDELAARSRRAAAKLPTWDEAATILLDLYASVDARRQLVAA